jgi:2-methylcitrate dehydratase PrpD
VLYRGIWPTYFAAPFGIAAVAARLMKLDAGQTAHALALALTLAPPGVGHHNAPTTSNVYGLKPDVSRLTDGLGDDFALTHVSFKPWCAARQTMAATQALKELIESGLRPDDIESIEAHVLPPHLKMIDHGVIAGDRASFLTSVQYHLAMAALMPDAPANVGLPDEPSDAVRTLMGRITVKGDEALLADYPRIWPARVVMRTRKGTHELTVTHVPGDTARPFQENDIERKFVRYVAPVVQGDANDLFRRSLGVLEGSESAADLVAEIGALH